jgi:hypothetical protein
MQPTSFDHWQLRQRYGPFPPITEPFAGTRLSGIHRGGKDQQSPIAACAFWWAAKARTASSVRVTLVCAFVCIPSHRVSQCGRPSDSWSDRYAIHVTSETVPKHGSPHVPLLGPPGLVTVLEHPRVAWCVVLIRGSEHTAVARGPRPSRSIDRHAGVGGHVQQPEQLNGVTTPDVQGWVPTSSRFPRFHGEQ